MCSNFFSHKNNNTMKLAHVTAIRHNEGFLFIDIEANIKQGDLIINNINRSIGELVEGISTEEKEKYGYQKLIACSPELAIEKLPYISMENLTHQQEIQLEVDLETGEFCSYVTAEHKFLIPIRVIETKTYTVVVDELSNETSICSRTNDGFTAYELIGYLTKAIHDIEKQIEGKLKPMVVKPVVIKK